MPLILAFDPGYRNLAYCAAVLGDAPDAPARVAAWGVADMGAGFAKLGPMERGSVLRETLDGILEREIGAAWDRSEDTTVLVENQPSRASAAVRGVQLGIFMYMAMRRDLWGEPVRALQVSARVKLRSHAREEKRTYRDRKATAVEAAGRLCEGCPDLTARLAAAKKKDDMADTLMYIAEHGGIAAFVHGGEEVG